MSIREKCEQILSGIDEDTLEYIVSMIEGQIDDSEPLSEISEGIAGFILSSEFTETEEAAQEYCDQIMQAVQSEASSATPISIEPQLLKSKLVISKESAVLLPPPPKKEESTPATFGRAAPTHKSTSSAKSASSSSGKGSKGGKGKSTAAGRVYSQALQLEEELEAARVVAARARSRDGAFNGALGKLIRCVCVCVCGGDGGSDSGGVVDGGHDDRCCGDTDADTDYYYYYYYALLLLQK
jgi:hypothetical protein